MVFGHYEQKEPDFPDDKRVIDIIRDVAEFLPLANGEKFSASRLLEQFLFSPAQQYQFAKQLSGGEKRRLALLKLLISNPNFLILDEPTNDLDLLTISILEDFLLQFQGCLLIISHDRSFLDRLVDHLFVFEGEGKISDFRGDYSSWEVLQHQKNQKTDSKVQYSSSPCLVLESGKTSPLSPELQKELDQLIKDLEALEKEKAEITQLFENKDLAYDEISLLSEHLGEIHKQIARKEARRFEISMF